MRSGKYNLSARKQVLDFLRNNESVEIEETKGPIILWSIFAGDTILLYDFSSDTDSYTINVSDIRNNKTLETWKDELANLSTDLQDTITFVDDYISSTSSAKTEIEPAKTKD